MSHSNINRILIYIYLLVSANSLPCRPTWVHCLFSGIPCCPTWVHCLLSVRFVASFLFSEWWFVYHFLYCCPFLSCYLSFFESWLLITPLVTSKLSMSVFRGYHCVISGQTICGNGGNNLWRVKFGKIILLYIQKFKHQFYYVNPKPIYLLWCKYFSVSNKMNVVILKYKNSEENLRCQRNNQKP